MPWVTTISGGVEKNEFFDELQYDEEICGYQWLRHEVGTYTCGCVLPRLSIPTVNCVWVSPYCAAHTNKDSICESDCPDEIAGEIDTIIAEVISNNTVALLSGQEHELGDLFGSVEFPVSYQKFEKLQISNLETRELHIRDCNVAGPTFIKDCRIENLIISLRSGSILTIVDSEIPYIEWASEDSAPLKIWYANSSIERIQTKHCKIREIGAEKSIISQHVLDADAKINGRITLTRSVCNFENGDFSSASVTVAKRVSFSKSLMKGCEFSSWTTDEWRLLLRNYGGNSALFAMLLFLAFAFPILTDYALWSAVSELQPIIQKVISQKLLLEGEFSRCLAPSCDDVSLILLIFGYSNGSAYMAVTTSLLLLNVLRILMVREVSIIKENSDISGRYPERGKLLPTLRFNRGPGGSMFDAWRHSYRHLTYIHYLINILLLVSSGSFALSLYRLGTTVVSIPAGN